MISFFLIFMNFLDYSGCAISNKYVEEEQGIERIYRFLSPICRINQHLDVPSSGISRSV